MKLNYNPDTDSLYIELSDEDGVDSAEIQPGIVLDFDANDQLVGIDVQQASQTVDLTRIEATSLPLHVCA